MDLELTGRNCVVIGGSRGIGRAARCGSIGALKRVGQQAAASGSGNPRPVAAYRRLADLFDPERDFAQAARGVERRLVGEVG